MTALTVIGLGVLAFVAVGLALVAGDDFPSLDSLSREAAPTASDFDPYTTEAQAYLIDRDAA
jgi:hypothetical protein